MFAAITRALVKSLGAQGDLVCNENVNEKIEMLTLVRARVKTFWPIIRYTIIDQTLLDLLEQPDVSTGLGLNMLKLKHTDKLMFVYQKVYNSAPVMIYGKAGRVGSLSAVNKTFLTLNVMRNKKEETSFMVPRDSIFAYGLMDITTEDETLGIPLRTRKVRHYNKDWWSISSDGVEDSCETLQQVKEEIFQKAALLQPLADLPESSRRDLLKTLSELLDDRDALSLLEETLDQSSNGEYERPQSPTVSSFMDVLDVCGASSSQQDAAHLLVSAMDTLPHGAAALLVNCSPETLRVLNQTVSSLKEDAQVKLPESLPVSLQEEGELRWAAELLCLTNEMQTELTDQWDRPDFPPEVLLELLCVVVQGLSMMQPETHS